MVSPPSESCAVAFKEWAGVCDALIAGRQNIVVRKGGSAKLPARGHSFRNTLSSGFFRRGFTKQSKGCGARPARFP